MNGSLSVPFECGNGKNDSMVNINCVTLKSRLFQSMLKLYIHSVYYIFSIIFVCTVVHENNLFALQSKCRNLKLNFVSKCILHYIHVLQYILRQAKKASPLKRKHIMIAQMNSVCEMYFKF